MALVAANLHVSWVSVFVGQHRVCWAIAPSVIYDCTTVIYCGGGPCSVDIPITVDNESCDAVTYQGYVQASCEDIGSMTGRVPFSITFTPTPTCISYNVACVGVPVLSLTEVLHGKGYDVVGAVPSVSITLGGGAGATGVATIGNSTIITNNGTAGVNGVYLAVAMITSSGIGTGGFADVHVTGNHVTSIVPTTTGINYFPGDTITFNAAFIGGCEAVVVTFGVNYGTVTAVNITGNGDNYTSIPTVTIAPPPGAGITATALAVLDVCPDQLMGPMCGGGSQTLTGMALGQSAIECMTALPDPINPDYIFTPVGCCYDCVTVTFTWTAGGDPTIYYTDCLTHEITSVLLDPSSPTTVCCVNNSWYWNPSDATVVVVVGASCP